MCELKDDWTPGFLLAELTRCRTEILNLRDARAMAESAAAGFCSDLRAAEAEVERLEAELERFLTPLAGAKPRRRKKKDCSHPMIQTRAFGLSDVCAVCEIEIPR